MTFVYDESGKLKCSSCSSYVFDLVIEQRVSNVSRNNGDDPVANRTVESENIISLICARCGVKIK